MLKNIKLILIIEFENADQAEVAYKAIEPEVMSSPSDRAKSFVFLKDNKIFIRLTGNDRSAVRSSLNSYMRWLKLVKELIEYGKKST